jgi:hypothetical protein
MAGWLISKAIAQAEAEHHRSELLRAGELLTANFPGIAVEPYFVKFDGIWEVKGDNAAEFGVGKRGWTAVFETGQSRRSRGNVQPLAQRLPFELLDPSQISLPLAVIRVT